MNAILVRRPEEAHDASAQLQEHFEDAETQSHAAQLGMWVFLASEILMFSALFALYAGYRTAYADTFQKAARETNLVLGTTMTFVLLIGSLVVALAVHFIRHDRTRPAFRVLAAGAVLAVGFLGLKVWEYLRHFNEGIYPGFYYEYEKLTAVGARVFFSLYYVMTGLHFLHVLGGALILGALAWATRRGHYASTYHTPLKLGGMYWHLVDIIWLFLWPIFYLMR